MPIVLVELPAADAADVNAPALIAACSEGLRRGTCAVEEVPGGERATAIAIVVWLDADHLRARIDVGRRAERRGGWQVRELTFHEQDEPLERWRSVGLAIAGVVGEATLFEPARPAPARVPTSKPVSPPAAISPRRFRVTLGPALETGLSAEKPTVGAWIEAGLRYSRAVPLELTVSAANAWSLRETSGIASRFTTFGVGMSGTLAPSQSSWAVRASLLAALEAADVSVMTNPANRAHASGARWLFAGVGRLQAIWPAQGPFASVLGAEITRLSGATEVKIHDQPVAVSPAWRGGIQVGLEWRF